MLFKISIADDGEARAFVRLLREVRRSRRSAFSEGSHSNLRSQFRSYFAFCFKFRRTPLPADIDTVCAYAQFLSRSVKHGTIANYLSGLKMLHILLGYPYPFTGDPSLRLLLRGLHRLNPHVPNRAPPITPTHLLQVHAHLDHQDSLECTVFACSLFLFFTLSRVGSVLPRSAKKAKSSRSLSKSLTRDRVDLRHPDFAIVTFLHTKTIQFGQRVLQIPLLRSDTALCPVAAYKHALDLVRSSRHLAAFSYSDAGGHILPLLPRGFIDVFRRLLARAGVQDAHRFRGHSFRRGGASWAFDCGVPGELIQIMGDWKSDAYRVYLEFSLSSKVTIAQRLVSRLPAIASHSSTFT